MKHAPLTHLSEDDLLWIGLFADRLREREPAFAQDDAGLAADDVARRMFEQPGWREMPAQEAADRCLADPASCLPMGLRAARDHRPG